MNGRTNSTKGGDIVYDGPLIPLEPVTQFAIVPRDGSALLTWVDPVDKVASPGGESVANWSHTDIIRKVGSAPIDINDGELAVRETIRNQYQTAAFTDIGLENNKKYHYAAYAISNYNMISDGTLNSVIPVRATPQYYTKLSESTSPDNILHRVFMGLSCTDKHAVIAGGQVRSNVKTNSAYAISSSLSKQNLNSIDSHGSVTSVATGAHHIIYGNSGNGDKVTSYDDSTLSKTSLADLATPDWNSSGISASVTFNDCGIFTAVHYVPSSGYSSIPSDAMYVYSDNLTVDSSHTLATATINASCAADEHHVLIAGGQLNNSTSANSTRVDTVNAFDLAFTRQVLTPLRKARDSAAGVNVGKYYVFAGGYSTYNSMTGEPNFGRLQTVDAYDENLTRISVNDIPITNVGGYFGTKCGINALLLLSTTYAWYDPSLTLTQLDHTSEREGEICGTMGDYAMFFTYSTDNVEIFHNV